PGLSNASLGAWHFKNIRFHFSTRYLKRLEVGFVLFRLVPIFKVHLTTPLALVILTQVIGDIPFRPIFATKSPDPYAGVFLITRATALFADNRAFKGDSQCPEIVARHCLETGGAERQAEQNDQ